MEINDIITAVISLIVAVFAGGKIWDYFRARYKQKHPTLIDKVQSEGEMAKLALEIARASRGDTENLRKIIESMKEQVVRIEEQRLDCMNHLEEIKEKHTEQIKAMEKAYQRQIALIKDEHKHQLEAMRAQYEEKLQEYREKSKAEIEALREKIQILEEERRELLELRAAIESGH